MKKIAGAAAIIFAAVLTLTLAGCHGKTTYLDANGNPTTAPTQSVAPETPASEAPAAEGTETPAADTTETPAGDTTETPAAESTTETPAAESSTETPAAESSTETPAAESSEEAPAAESSEEETPTENVTDYIYFDNSTTKWDVVYAYWWNDTYSSITNKLTGDLYPANKEDGTQDLQNSWPGVQLERVGDSDVFRCVVPVGASKIIFNSGVSDADVKAGTEAYQSAEIVFSENDNAGQVYAIDTSVEAKPGRGIEKTKFRYSEGSWSAYNG